MGTDQWKRRFVWFEETASIEVVLTLATCTNGEQEAMRQAAPRHE